ncbi:MAG: formate dehydrogenase accessory sulfurtransferase FdhD [Alphaproteobacteria bacterium]
MSRGQKKFSPAREVSSRTLSRSGVRRSMGLLAVESALEVVINGRPHSLLMYTPGAEKELVAGYLHTEGLIDAPGEITGLEFEKGPGFLEMEGQKVQVALPGLPPELPLPDRPVLSLSGCGLCGKEALDRAGRGLFRVRSKQAFSWSVLPGLLKDLPRRQPLYRQTRGVHAAAMYQADGTFLCCYEDVGRHNALDKVIGRGLLAGWSFDDKLVVLSGRASLEMVLKTVRAGMPLCLCFSSPSVLAVEAAKAFNLTLAGRQEDRSLAAYTHTRRLKE